MKSIKKLILFTLLIVITNACSKSDNPNESQDEPQNQNSEIILTIADNSTVTFTTITGMVSNDYETGLTVNANLNASQETGNKTLSMTLFDNLADDPIQNAQPFSQGGVFPIGDSSLLVYGTLNYTDDSTTFNATNGTLTVTSYITNDEDGGQQSVEILSGTLSVSDGSTSITGTLTNIVLTCGECAG